MTFSAIKATEDALLAALLARPNLASLAEGGAPELGNPGANLMGEHVFIWEDVSSDHHWDLTAAGVNGTFRREEHFELRVTVSVKQSGDDWPTIRTRAHALGLEVETAALVDVSLGGIDYEVLITRIERGGFADDMGRLCQITYTFDVTCYLT